MKKVFLSLSLLALAGVASSRAVTATAYSLHGITAQGTRTTPGTLAVSRDLLSIYPYGSVLQLYALKGAHCRGFKTTPLKVLDTMRADKYNTVDVWFPSNRQALSWGRCTAHVRVLHRP